MAAGSAAAAPSSTSSSAAASTGPITPARFIAWLLTVSTVEVGGKVCIPGSRLPRYRYPVAPNGAAYPDLRAVAKALGLEVGGKR